MVFSFFMSEKNVDWTVSAGVSALNCSLNHLVCGGCYFIHQTAGFTLCCDSCDFARTHQQPILSEIHEKKTIVEWEIKQKIIFYSFVVTVFFIPFDYQKTKKSVEDVIVYCVHSACHAWSVVLWLQFIFYCYVYRITVENWWVRIEFSTDIFRCYPWSWSRKKAKSKSIVIIAKNQFSVAVFRLAQGFFSIRCCYWLLWNGKLYKPKFSAAVIATHMCVSMDKRI